MPRRKRVTRRKSSRRRKTTVRRKSKSKKIQMKASFPYSPYNSSFSTSGAYSPSSYSSSSAETPSTTTTWKYNSMPQHDSSVALGPTHYVGVLPYAHHQGTRYYLLGKEHLETGWDGSGKWSDFGGDPEGEEPYIGAAREFYEETMGFFGNLEELKLLVRNGIRVQVGGGYTFLVEIPFDPNVSILFERVHRYFLQCASMHKQKKGYMFIPSCPSGMYEKTDIRWIKEADL